MQNGFGAVDVTPTPQADGVTEIVVRLCGWNGNCPERAVAADKRAITDPHAVKDFPAVEVQGLRVGPLAVHEQPSSLIPVTVLCEAGAWGKTGAVSVVRSKCWLAACGPHI